MSLRRRIMICISISLLLMIVILMLTTRMNFKAIKNLGDSYQSNSELDYFSQQLAQSEKSLETYINYHTFESIDSYYNYRNKIEELSDQMQANPSTNEVKQKEYIVNQFTKSFVELSSKAIAARRANNTEEMNDYYGQSLACYNMLLSQILELNKLLLQQNAQEYQLNKQRISTSTSVSYVFFFIFAALIFFILYLTITQITRPLMEISEVAHRVSKRDFDVPLFNKSSNDEIGNICRAFDRMIISIREYIDTIWEKARTEAELKEKEIEMQALYTDAQLKALQNQINPHFLFNTLNTGAQLAMMEGADKTCYFIEQVSDFFRYNIQNQNKTATIDEELGLVDNFVYIMKVRFGARLEFVKNIPDEPLKDLIPVMTLQPLVENCIKHGLKNTKGKVELTITREKKNIIITVSDNGNGMSEEIKESVFKAVAADKTRLEPELLQPDLESVSAGEKENHTGTGLLNVILRLKLYFHRDDIFDITSGDDGVGTKFIIKVPSHV